MRGFENTTPAVADKMTFVNVRMCALCVIALPSAGIIVRPLLAELVLNATCDQCGRPLVREVRS